MNSEQILELVFSVMKEKTQENQEKIPFEIGKAYFFRTVTYHITGRVKKIVGKFLILEDAAWIADSGRFQQAIMDGVLSEVEPVSVETFLNIDSITDAFFWQKELPREQK